MNYHWIGVLVHGADHHQGRLKKEGEMLKPLGGLKEGKPTDGRRNIEDDQGKDTMKLGCWKDISVQMIHDHELVGFVKPHSLTKIALNWSFW